jgi:hypothetical protein
MDEHINRLNRIEEKLDKVGEAVVSLARMEERMITLFKRMDAYDERQNKMDERLGQIEINYAKNSWIERAAWVIFAAVIAGSAILK